MKDNGEHAIAVDALRLDKGARAGTATLTDRVRSLRLPQDKPSSAGFSSWLMWLVILLLAANSAGLDYLLFNRADMPGANPAGPVAGADDKSLSTASDQNLAPSTVASSGDIVLESKGYIVPVHQIQVSPKVSGMVVKLNIEEGKKVKQGEILAELEKVEYLADRDRAKATLESSKQRLLELQRGNRKEDIQAAKAELDEAEANREQLFKEWKRDVNLKTGNALPAREYEQAFGAYKAMDRRMEKLRQNYQLMVIGPRQERIDGAKAEVLQGEADLAKCDWRLENCVIRAPIKGTILVKYAEEGNIVNQLSMNLKGSICDMADLGDLEVDLNIQERDVGKVFKGQSCQVRPDAFPDKVYEGLVSRLMPIGDRAKGAVPVRVRVKVPEDEEGIYLKPEMSVNVSFFKKPDKH